MSNEVRTGLARALRKVWDYVSETGAERGSTTVTHMTASVQVESAGVGSRIHRGEVTEIPGWTYAGDVDEPIVLFDPSTDGYTIIPAHRVLDIKLEVIRG